MGGEISHARSSHTMKAAVFCLHNHKCHQSHLVVNAAPAGNIVFQKVHESQRKPKKPFVQRRRSRSSRRSLPRMNGDKMFYNSRGGGGGARFGGKYMPFTLSYSGKPLPARKYSNCVVWRDTIAEILVLAAIRGGLVALII